ncbi:hypothetical protein [Leeia oryzae]|uniref:hypothetical protein n=1 Tax=Leeia oryzae TaxID=356662 RepID=UPI000373B6E5|nr:hypothetical protein [Leeia oryzae]
MSTHLLLPPLETGETGGLHRHLTTLEAALDYALIKKGSARTPNRETWQVTFTALAKAASRRSTSADMSVAHRLLASAIDETLRARESRAS